MPKLYANVPTGGKGLVAPKLKDWINGYLERVKAGLALPKFKGDPYSAEDRRAFIEEFIGRIDPFAGVLKNVAKSSMLRDLAKYLRTSKPANSSIRQKYFRTAMEGVAELERIPQKELDRVASINFSFARDKGSTRGLYYPPPGQRRPRIELLPRGGGGAETLRHELIHGRQHRPEMSNYEEFLKALDLRGLRKQHILEAVEQKINEEKAITFPPASTYSSHREYLIDLLRYYAYLAKPTEVHARRAARALAGTEPITEEAWTQAFQRYIPKISSNRKKETERLADLVIEATKRKAREEGHHIK